MAHGYDSVDDLVVWGIIENDLDHLIEDATRLLGVKLTVESKSAP